MEINEINPRVNGLVQNLSYIIGHLSDLGEKEDSDAVWQKYNQVLLI